MRPLKNETVNLFLGRLWNLTCKFYDNIWEGAPKVNTALTPMNIFITCFVVDSFINLGYPTFAMCLFSTFYTTRNYYFVCFYEIKIASKILKTYTAVKIYFV